MRTPEDLADEMRQAEALHRGGRYAVAVGRIRALTETNLLTDAERVVAIRETLAALDLVERGESGD